jgi:hypothetical protein
MSDAKVMEELDVNTNAYYTLRSRLNQKIEEYLLAQMESPRTDLLKKVANINDVVFTKKRAIASATLKKLEKELLDYDLANELTIVYKTLKKLHLNTPDNFTYSQQYNRHVAYMLAMESSKVFRPKKGILVSAGPEHEKMKFLPWAKKLTDLGLKLYATEGTAAYLAEHGVAVTPVAWPGESTVDSLDPLELIRRKEVDLVVNIPKNLQRDELTRGSMIRQAATSFGCSVVTNMEKMIAYATAITYYPDFAETHRPGHLPQYQ